MSQIKVINEAKSYRRRQKVTSIICRDKPPKETRDGQPVMKVKGKYHDIIGMYVK